MEERKKILVVDDSALMRRVLCDIINSDKRFLVEAKAKDGLEALELLSKYTYDAVVLDVNMPNMGGLELLQELQKRKIAARVMMASTDTRDGTETTLKALELGAMDFIHKPYDVAHCRQEDFVEKVLNILYAVSTARITAFEGKKAPVSLNEDNERLLKLVNKHLPKNSGRRLIAIASSTGGPKALHEVIPRLPQNIGAPILLVQHMPKGFTASLAQRLDEISEVTVTEAKEGDVLENGHVYIAQGGMHMKVAEKKNGELYICYSDEAAREGVKPCANYLFESFINCSSGCIVCVVLTGMGADGTEGIRNLKAEKSIHTIAQNEDSCVVYGMPKSIVKSGLSDQIVPLDQIAQEILLQVGTC